jgi:hypothetical protein
VSPRYFAHYWRNRTLETYRASGDVDLHYVADNRFAERGVKAEDVVYPVTIRDGVLYLIGRLEVERVCDFEEAKAILGYEPSWEASYYLIGVEPTQKYFDLLVSPEVVCTLRFVTRHENKPLKFESPGHLDQQTLRGVRELDPDSAATLDRLLASR